MGGLDLCTVSFCYEEANIKTGLMRNIEWNEIYILQITYGSIACHIHQFI